MPLSEHEQKLLEQIERALYAEDPQFASKVRTATPRAQTTRKLARSVLIMVVGLAVIILGVSIDLAPLGAVGFAIMLLGGYLALRGSKSAVPSSPPPRAPRQSAPNSSITGRMEDRWRRRWEDRDI